MIPILVTDDVIVIVEADYDCVAEYAIERSVVVSDCNTQPGNVISATFYIPSMEINGYCDRLQEKLAMIVT